MSNAMAMASGGNRDAKGRFLRNRQPWSPDRWDDGYEDAVGYFRVYCPNFPAAYGSTSTGYAKRAHVIWWLMTGQVPPPGYVIHHRNENKLDDRIENLELKRLGNHTREHNERRKLEAAVVCSCKNCGKLFVLQAFRVRAGRGKYCSPGCYRVKRQLEKKITEFTAGKVQTL